MGTRTANMPPKKWHGFSMYNLSTSAKYSTPFFPKIQEKNLSISHFSPDCTWKTHVIFSGHIAASRTHLMAAYTSLHSPWLLRITCPNTTKLLHVGSSCSFRGSNFSLFLGWRFDGLKRLFWVNVWCKKGHFIPKKAWNPDLGVNWYHKS